MFPAIRQAWKELREGFGYEPIELGLKAATVDESLLLLRSGFKRTYEAYNGFDSQSWSGEWIGEKTTLTHSVVWACTRVRSTSLASLPLHLYERTATGREQASDHRLYQILHDEPNPHMSSFEFRQAMEAHVLLWGNAYAQIVRRSGTGQILQLIPIHPASVLGVVRREDGSLIYRICEAAGKEKEYDSKDIFHVKGLTLDGLQGLSVITYMRQSVGTALSADRFAAMFYAAGGRVQYVLEMAQRFKTEQEYQRFSKDFREWLENRNNWHKGLILEPGMTYKNIGLTPEDSQFLETRQFQIPEICRWFGVQPHLVGDLSRATNNNIEHQSIEFVMHTMRPSLTAWEGAIKLRLLTPAERQRYYAEFNVDGLLRADYESRTKGYASLLQNGVYSINEVRTLENMNRRDGCDAHHIQLNQQTVPGTGEPTAAELAAIAKFTASQEANGGQRNAA